MILRALATYYDRLVQEGTGIATEGFEKKGIPFIIVIDKGGRFRGLQDTREGEGKKKAARIFTVPKSVKRSNGIAANLLWDNPTYVIGRCKPVEQKDEKRLEARAKEQHEAFLVRIRETFPEGGDEGVQAVLSFLEKGDFSSLLSHTMWPDIEESGGNLSFQLEGEATLVCQRQAVLQAVVRDGPTAASGLDVCMVTGGMDEPARLHTAIKGVWGAQSSGANIVSFNLPSFNSYGKEQGYNAPVGRRAESAYTTALNTLLAKGSRQRIQVGDASTVFWAAQPSPLEGWFADFFGEPAKTGPSESAQDTEAVKALYVSPRTGALPLEQDLTPFYVLGLSPNASRLAVRTWYAGTVGDVVQHVRQHFDDISILHGPNQPDFLSLFRLLVSTAVQGDSDNIRPNLAASVMKAVLTGLPYPGTLLAATVSRIRAEQSRKDPKTDKVLPNVTYPRAALIKAVLVRDSRFYARKEKEVEMSLDISNTNSGYRLGRLFAVLEKAQEEANPGINATIRDRFYGAASSTPVVAFPHLLKLKNYHIAKLESRGRAINLEKQVSEIVGGLEDFPAHLSLADQGRFAIGYYHQRQDFFTKKDSGAIETKEGN